MITEIKCRCGRNHTAKISKLILEKNAFLKLFDEITDYVSGGKICIITNEDYSFYAKTLEEKLIKSDYRVKTLVFARNTDNNIEATDEIVKQDEDTRLFIAVGNEQICRLVANTVSNNMLCVLSPMSTRIVELETRVLAIDLDIISKGNSDYLAHSYGDIFIKYLGVFDWKNNSYLSKKFNCFSVVDAINFSLDNFFHYEFDNMTNYEKTETIINSVIQIGIYISMLEEKDVFYNYDVIVDNLFNIVTDGEYGEVEMMVGYYVLLTLSEQLEKGQCNILYPTDKISDANILAKLNGGDVTQVLSLNKLVGSGNIMRFQYVLDEYKEDILNVLVAKKCNIANAIKQFRRLYTDAGKKFSDIITINMLAKITNVSAIMMKNYCLFRHYKEIGNI